MLKTNTRVDNFGGRSSRSGRSNALLKNCSNLTKSKNCLNLTKFKNLTKSNYIAGESDFLTLNAKAAFIQLRQAFTKTPTLCHFKSNCYICIKIDISSHAIGGILSQLITKIGK